MLSSSKYLKVPCEMAIYAFRERFVPQIRSYLTFHFLYSGKARTTDRPARAIAKELRLSERVVYNHFNALADRNWIGKDTNKGWWFFRGIDRIHHIENWQFSRAAVMMRRDLQTIKPFFASAVIASLAQTKTGKGQRAEPKLGGSEPPAVPISLKYLSNILGVCEKTVFRLRKKADELKYIENQENLIPIINLKPPDLKLLKRSGLSNIKLELHPNSKVQNVALNRIRYRNNKLYLQAPNEVRSHVRLKNRKGISQYRPP